MANMPRKRPHEDSLPEDLQKLVAHQIEASLSGRNKYIILAHPSMDHIKKALIELDPLSYTEVKVDWREFESGMPNIFIEEVHKLLPAHVLLLLNMRRKEILLDQLSLLYAIPRYGCRSLTVLLPFFPTGTMEMLGVNEPSCDTCCVASHFEKISLRVDREGEVATASTLSRMISAVPMTPGGPARFLIFDIHALQIRFYFQDSILPVLLSAMPLLLNLLKTRYASEERESEKLRMCLPSFTQRRMRLPCEDRSLIRGMWGAMSCGRAQFAICGGADAPEMSLLHEQTTFGDLLLLDCEEGYGEGLLVKKVLAALEVFLIEVRAQKGRQPMLFMKVDDDSFVAWSHLCPKIESLDDPTGLLYMGMPDMVNQLEKRGAKKVSVFVTHGVFPQGSWQKFEGGGFDRIFITDSIVAQAIRM
eukprot:g26973.t1